MVFAQNGYDLEGYKCLVRFQCGSLSHAHESSYQLWHFIVGKETQIARQI